MEHKTSLYLICETQTNWYKEKRIQGSCDTELNEEGETQAKLLCEVFKPFPIQAVYTSPKKRAHGAAKILAKSLKISPIVQENLVEKSMGLAEGMGIEEFNIRYKEQIQNHFSLGYYERLFNKIVEDQESSIDLAERALPALHAICKAHPNEHIVVVTHEWVLKVLLILIGKYKEESMEIESGAVLEMAGNGSRLEIVTMQGIKAEKGTTIQM